MNYNIIGYVTEISGNFSARNSHDGSSRELKLNDPIYEGDFVVGEGEGAKIIIGFNDSGQQTMLTGNEGLLFDAALLDEKFNIDDLASNDFEYQEQAGEEDELSAGEGDEPGAGEEDLEGEGNGSAVFSERTADETNVNSELRDAIFLAQQPEKHDSFTIIDDVPEAVQDVNRISEDSLIDTVYGNVFSNDDLGNDSTDFPVTSVNGGAVGTDVEGDYGVVVINSDGSYSYQLNNDNLTIQSLASGETLSEVFTYTITDSDGDSATTTLTITIEGTDDGVTLTIPDNDGVAGGDEEQVFESALATGSAANETTESVSSSFSIKALDGVETLVIAGTSISAAQLEASASTPVTITTTLGSLVINGYALTADGTIKVDYTYTLTTAQDHSTNTVSDAISIVVTDTDGDSTSDVLSIKIVDDVPTAVSDSNTISEDSVSISANVFTNDIIGADQTTIPVTGVEAGESSSDVSGQTASPVIGSYGELVMQTDGSYTYVIDNTNLDVQDLTTDETLSEIFTYTITDSDGDSSSTTLTITIEGTNDGVMLTIPDAQVHESGLASGSTPDETTEAVSNSFTFTALDGLESITVAGTQISADELAASATTPILITSTLGSLEINGYVMADDGTITVDYTYTLTGAQDHSAGTVSDTISIVVTDTDGDSHSDTLTINIVDDAPIAKNDPDRNVLEGGNTITGNVIDNVTDSSGDDLLSADASNTITSFVYTDESGDLVSGTVGIEVDTQYGSLTVEADGSWKYISDSSEDHTSTESLTEQFTYTLTDSDGDSDTAVQVITVSDATDPTIDNGNNPTVIVYEGSSTATFNGTDNYAESTSTASQDTTSTLTHQLNFTAGSDDAGISSFTFNGITAQIAVGGSATISGTDTTTDEGTLTVNYDGTWSYTAPETYEHDDASGVNSFTTIFTYTVTDTDGDNVTTGSQTIQVDDTVPTLTGASNTTIDEQYLSTGSTPDSTQVTQTGTITATQTSGAVDITFSESTITSLTAQGLTSDGDTVSYSLSLDGHSITASAEGSTVFTVTITDPTNADDVGYEVVLFDVLDHTTNDDIVLNLAINIEDDDGDTADTSFTLTIVDDAPTANDDAERTVVEGGNTITGNVIDNTTDSSGDDLLSADSNNTITSFVYTNEAETSVTIAVDSINGTTVDTQYGSLTVEADGSWTYTSDSSEVHPSTNSLTDQFTYTLTDSDGSSDTAVQVITVLDGTNPSIDNDHNLTVIVYEGSATATFNGTDNYAKSDGSASQGTTSTLTHQLDFTAGSDDAGISSFTFNGVTAQITVGGSATISGTDTTTDEGTLTVNYDGTWSYSAPGTYVHADASGVNSFTTTFTYTVTDSDSDTATTTGSQTIQVDDTVPTLTGASNSIIDEQYLSTGSNPDSTQVTQTGTITATQTSGDIDITFSESTITSLTAQGLTSAGDTISYSLSEADHTIIASANGTTVFTVTITEPTNANDVGYQVVLFDVLDHTTNDDIVLDLAINIEDDDGDTADSSFTITIVDDAPSTTDSMTVDEDSDNNDAANTITTSADATSNNTSITTDPSYGSVLINTDGTLTYTPNSDYSGPDELTYTTINDDGTSSTTTVAIIVNPIADAPTNLVDASSLTTEEDTAIALGLNAPTQPDSTDTNDSIVDTDNPELYGVITISDIPSGASIIVADGADGIVIFTATDTNSDLTIVLSNGDHVAGTTGYLTLSITAYENLKILPAADSGDNFTITVSVSSYEVTDAGVAISGVAAATTTETISVDVQAVTDEVTLTYTVDGDEADSDNTTYTTTIDEDSSFDLGAILNETFGDASDGSETYSYTISNVPEGTTLSINGTQATADADGSISVEFTGVTPSISITPPTDFSGDITGITVTFSAVDSDSDSTDATPIIVTESASVTLNLYVNPIANDIVLDDVTVAEDTPIAFLANLSVSDDNDGTETITSIKIANLDTGFELTTADGTVFYTSTADDSSYTITIGSTTDINTHTFTIEDATSILLDSNQAHSSADISLDISVTATDVQTVNGVLVSDQTTTEFTSANGYPLIITVTPVAETNRSDSDSDGTNDVVTQGSHIYTTSIDEDSGWIDLNTLDTSFSLSVSNEDASSEATVINFSNVPVGSQFTTDGGITVYTVTDSDVGVGIALAELSTLQFMPAEQYSGTIEIVMTVITTDYDEDDSTITDTATSDPDTLTLVVAPVADQVTLAVQQASGYEDAGRSDGNTSAVDNTVDDAENGIALDITTTSDDTDGSETFVVIISDIPAGAEIYYNGTLMTIDSGTSGNLTATENTDATWSLTIKNFDSDATLSIIPASNDDSDYTLQVNAYTVDDSDNSISVSQTLSIDIDVAGVADSPINDELNSLDADGKDVDTGIYNYVTSEATLDSGNNQISLQDIYIDSDALSSYDSDGSESLTIVVSGLSSEFSIENASFIGGEDEDRQWIFSIDDLDSITISTSENYSGEIDFTVTYITTESEGDSATSEAEDVTILVTPSAEASIETSTSIDEDQLTQLDFSIVYANSDTDETLETVYIKIDDVNNGDFTLYFGDSTALTLADALVSNDDISIISLDGNDYYQLSNSTFENVYALGAADSTGSYNFEVKYDISDNVTTKDGTTQDTLTGSIDYALTINAVTDDIDINVTSIVVGTEASISGTDITVTGNTIITVDIDITGDDDLDEGNSGNGADTDGSEQVTQFIITGVSSGIAVVGGTYAGDIYNSDTGEYENSGTWYLAVDESLDSDGVSQTITFEVIGDDTLFTTEVSDITITAYNDDDSNNELQSDSTTITIIKDDSYTGSDDGEAATIETFEVNSLTFLEDSSFTLDQAISVELTGSSDFTIVLTELPDGTTVTGAIQLGDTWVVSGDSSDPSTALEAVTITLPDDYNSYDSNDSDTFSFNATLTTYDGVMQNNSNLSFNEPVYPVTDDVTISVDQDGTVTEDTDYSFSITVSDSADGDNTIIIDDKMYIKITETYTDSDSSTDAGTLTYDSHTLVVQILTAGNNDAGLVGSYYVITGVEYGDTLDFIYTPAEDRQGNVDVEVYIQNQEAQGWGNSYPNTNTEGDVDTEINLSSQNFTFDITPIMDASNISANDVSGTEDESSITGGENWVKLDISVTYSDESEGLVTALLDNIPDGFIIYYEDPDNLGSYLLAYNAGTSSEYGDDYTLWSIPLVDGELPSNIYIQVPENWSGTLSDIEFTIFSEEENVTDLSESSAYFDVTVAAVADGLTLNSTTTFGNEGDDIALNLNANITDLDGSETVTLTFAGIGENANFKVSGEDIDEMYINYDSDTDVYTINNILVTDINDLSFVQQHFTGTVTVTAQTIDTYTDSDGSSVTDSSTIINDSFTVEISEVVATTGDDNVLYKGVDVDALDGSDTLILSNDVGIDFSSLSVSIENIEVINLSENGEHSLTNLSLSDVIAMTDDDNILTIEGDSDDALSFSGSDWVKSGSDSDGDFSYDIYTNVTDPSVTVHVEDAIVDTVI